MSEKAQLEALLSRVPGSFTVEWPDGYTQNYGSQSPTFHLRLACEDVFETFLSMNELRIAEAYVAGKFDVAGRMQDFIFARKIIRDPETVGGKLRLWLSFLRPIMTNRKAIQQHYDLEEDIQLAFMGKHRVYSHGHFRTGHETLDEAEEAKLADAFEALQLEPGQRVLDIGGGWGCFTEYAGRRGVRVDSLTISTNSVNYIQELIRRLDLPCRVIQCDFLRYRPTEPYDAIVILGVIEHIPQYQYFFEFINQYLRPGGRVYIDASASPVKYQMASFIRKYIYPGFSSCLYLPDFLRRMMDANVIINSLRVETNDYYWTARRWAEKLEERCREIVERWGEAAYRIFRLYLWGITHSFQTNELQAYHILGTRAPGPPGTTAVFGDLGEACAVLERPRPVWTTSSVHQHAVTSER
jgi:cyclopropane-fatty-acyl-phospholipid synthase